MSEPGAHSRWRGLLADVVVLLFVVGLGVKAAVGAGATRDLDAGDESFTIWSASQLAETGLPPVECSPLYTAWYALLLRCGVPVTEVMSLTWAVLAVALPASLFLLCRAAGAHRVAAMAAGGMLPATTLIDVLPYPMHLAAVILVSGTALAAVAVRRRHGAAAVAVAGFTLFTATYARPEFVYALAMFVALAAVAAGWALWRRPAARRSVVVAALSFAVSGALLVWGLGNPKGEGTRALFAFGQHYAWNRYHSGVTTHGENPWAFWEQYVRDDFGPVESLGGAWRSNPKAVLWHVAMNARTLPGALLATAEPRVDLTLLRLPWAYPLTPRIPSRHPNTEVIAQSLLGLAVGFGLVGALIGLRRQLLGCDEGQRGLIVLALGLAVVAAPALASSLIVYPRYHYLIPTVLFLIALAATGVHYLPAPAWWCAVARRPGVRIAAFVLLAVGLAAVVPNRAHGWCVQSRLGGGANGRSIVTLQTPWRDMVATLRGLGLRPGIMFVAETPAPSVYSGLGTQFLYPRAAQAEERFDVFVKRCDVGVILIEPVLIANFPLRDDPDFKPLLEGHDTPAFRLIPVPGQPRIRLAVRRDLFLAQ